MRITPNIHGKPPRFFWWPTSRWRRCRCRARRFLTLVAVRSSAWSGPGPGVVRLGDRGHPGVPCLAIPAARLGAGQVRRPPDAAECRCRARGAFYLFALRLVPLFPFFLINLVMGLTRIPHGTFYWVSQLGMFAGTARLRLRRHAARRSSAISGRSAARPSCCSASSRWWPRRCSTPLRRARSTRDGRPAARVVRLQPGRDRRRLGGARLGLHRARRPRRGRAGRAAQNGRGLPEHGCVPSKALIRSATLLSHIARAHTDGIAEASAHFDFAEVMERVRRVVCTIAPHDSVKRYESATASQVYCTTPRKSHHHQQLKSRRPKAARDIDDQVNSHCRRRTALRTAHSGPRLE